MPEMDGLLTTAYLVAAVLFILSLGGLSNQESARRGNTFGILGMVVAVVATLAHPKIAVLDQAMIGESKATLRTGPHDVLRGRHSRALHVHSCR